MKWTGELPSVTTEWVQSLTFALRSGTDPRIDGVVTRPLTPRVDGRGDVTELWSASWERDGVGPTEHVYQSAIDFGVVKCWHGHESQTDQFVVTRGKLQLTLADLRRDSPTFQDVNVLFVGSLNPLLVRVPPRVMHGWKALSPPQGIVVNFQSHPYDPADQFKLPWDCVLSEIWQPRNG